MATNRVNSDFLEDVWELERLRLERPQGYALEPMREVGDDSSNSSSESSSESGESEDQAEDPEIWRLTDLLWCKCKCKSCTLKPTVRESVCCREIGEIRHRISLLWPVEEQLTCICDNPEFHTYCLAVTGLDLAMLLLKDVKNGTLVRPITSR